MPATYDERRQFVRDYQASQRKSSQDIGEIPKIVDPIRRRDCIADFSLYCKTYHAPEFSKPWADYHRSTAERIQSCVETGGWYARALPRGGGKTTLCSAGVEWAALRGSHLYPIILGASESLGARLLKGIKTQLLTNDLLLADFPHAVYPIVQLGGEARRASGQKYKGESSFIEWGANRIVFPWIDEEESLSSGVVIEAYGITSAFRGLKHTRPDGKTVRPDIGLADDPQTRESAKSLSQTHSRLETLTGDMAYLAGPGQPMPIFCTATVIYEGDLADQILDRKKHPEWQGERTKMVESFPEELSLWDDYAEILRASLEDNGNIEPATNFYREHREAMDKGSAVSWEHRHLDTELSAIQHAMNLKIRDEASFYAEMQNEPIVAQDDMSLLSLDEVCQKTTGYNRGVVPDECSVVTAFTDIQKEHLFWMLVAWTPDHTGYVIDFGAWPDQKRNYFTRRDIRRKLSSKYEGDESAIVFASLTDLGEKIARNPYLTTSGREISLGRWCIDGNWRDRETAVKSFAKQSDFSGIITLTYGRGVKASHLPFSQHVKALKWKTGPGWWWNDGPGKARGVTFDANLLKKRVHDGLCQPINSKGSIQFFKSSPQALRMMAEHLLAEKPTKTEANGRTVYEFNDIPGRDNEGLDCLVGNVLAASIAGIKKGTEVVHVKKDAISLADMQRGRR